MTIRILTAALAALFLLLSAATPATADDYQRAMMYFEKQKYGKSAKYLKKTLRAAPENVDAWSLLGDCYHYREAHAEAVEAYKEAVALKPDDPELRFKLGASYELIMDMDKAFKEYKVLRKLDKKMAQKLYEQIFSE